MRCNSIPLLALAKMCSKPWCVAWTKSIGAGAAERAAGSLQRERVGPLRLSHRRFAVPDQPGDERTVAQMVCERQGKFRKKDGFLFLADTVNGLGEFVVNIFKV